MDIAIHMMHIILIFIYSNHANDSSLCITIISLSTVIVIVHSSLPLMTIWGDGVQLSLLKGDSLMTERVYLRASLAR